MFDKRKNSSPPDSAMKNEPIEPPMAANPGMTQSAGKAAVIGAGITVNGDISGTENILIEGRVDGRIQLASNDVTIGKSGQVQADVSAKTIRVAGEVKGDLKAKERVVISGTGNVRGNVVAPRVVLEDGAIFKGSIDMDPGDSANSGLANASTKAAAKANGSVNAGAAASAAASSATGNSSATLDSARKTPDLSLKGG